MPRPFSVTQEEYDRRWDMIFGRDQDHKEDSREDKPASTREAIPDNQAK
jgi:hypothetical protein